LYGKRANVQVVSRNPNSSAKIVDILLLLWYTVVIRF
jgi:hypothetical protein